MSKWEMVRLGDVATYVNGYAFKPSDWGIEGLPIIRIQDLTGNAYTTNFYNGICNEKYKVNYGDVLISWSASLGIYEWSKGEALLNQHIFKVIFDKVKIHKNYFIFTVRYLLEEMGKETHGSTMKHITKPRFDNMPFPLPPLDEQKRIAKNLDLASEIVKGYKEQLAELDKLIQSVFYEMFGDPVANEKGWEVSKLSELGELNRGVSKHRPRNAPQLLGGKYPLIQTGEVSNSSLYITSYTNTYSELGLKQSRLWHSGTLCITIAANIAQTAILTFDACFPDSVVGFLPNQKTNQIYMHTWFSFFQKILEEQAPQVAQKNINLRILGDLDVIVPSIALQTRFASIVTAIEAQKAQVQAALQEAQTLFNSLMQEYFE